MKPRLRRRRRSQPKIRRTPRGAGSRPSARTAGSGNLMIGSANDPAERAADQMADRALRRQVQPNLSPAFSSQKTLHRKCAECEEEYGDKDKTVRRDASAPSSARSSSAGPAGGPATPSAQAQVQALGSGRPLSGSERSFFEPRFNADFSSVRIHDNDAADRAADSVGARAFTLGQDIAFASGERQAGGDPLMAHELAHTLQDSRALHRQDKEEKKEEEPPTEKKSWKNTKYCQKLRSQSETIMKRLQKENKKTKYKIKEEGKGEKKCFRIQEEITIHIPQPGEGCDQHNDPKTLVKSHNVRSQTIEKPGDEAEIKLTFSCTPRSFKSRIVNDITNEIVVGPNDVKPSGEKPKYTINEDSTWTYLWDGKRPFDKVGTFMPGDGTFRHEITDLAYAKGRTGDKKIVGTASAGKPIIEIRSDQQIDKNPAAGKVSNHLYDDKGAEITANVNGLADAMFAEAKGRPDSERKAVGWAIRNTMARANVYTVAEARAANKFASESSGAHFKKLAREVLAAPMSADLAGGAMKWYSPDSMPKNKDQCINWKKYKFEKKPSCGAGLVTLQSDKTKSSMAPSFAKTMTYVPLKGVKEWYFRFFKL